MYKYQTNRVVGRETPKLDRVHAYSWNQFFIHCKRYYWSKLTTSGLAWISPHPTADATSKIRAVLPASMELCRSISWTTLTALNLDDKLIVLWFIWIDQLQLHAACYKHELQKGPSQSHTVYLRTSAPSSSWPSDREGGIEMNVSMLRA
jgi:hypothetical protein